MAAYVVRVMWQETKKIVVADSGKYLNDSGYELCQSHVGLLEFGPLMPEQATAIVAVGEQPKRTPPFQVQGNGLPACWGV